jgi:hypothetical protein
VTLAAASLAVIDGDTLLRAEAGALEAVAALATAFLATFGCAAGFLAGFRAAAFADFLAGFLAFLAIE